MNWKKVLAEKIETKKMIVGVIGIGYVGQAVVDLLIKKQIHTLGLTRNEEKVKKINTEKNTYFSASTDSRILEKCDVVVICVQTPIFENKLPDLSFIEVASQQIADTMHPGMLICVESSINPGVTKQVILPILKKSGYQEGKDFFLSFSPERVDPGNKKFPLEKIPKVVSGIDKNSLLLAKKFYSSFIQKVVPVSSVETAEMVKIFENTFRLVNISLVNELLTYTKKVNLDMWEVVRAAGTKPFGFLSHFPGPGIGGHCIPVDPYYLLDDAKKRNVTLRLIELSGEINDKQPKRVVQRAVEILNNYTSNDVNRLDVLMNTYDMLFPNTLPLDPQEETMHPIVGYKGGLRKSYADMPDTGKTPRNILLVGVAYKPDIDDLRESPALKIWDEFEAMGENVVYHDPYIPQVRQKNSQALTKKDLDQIDLIVIITNHSTINYQQLASYNIPILDTRHVYTKPFPHVYYL